MGDENLAVVTATSGSNKIKKRTRCNLDGSMSEQQKSFNNDSSTAEIGDENPVPESVAGTSGSQSSIQLTRNLYSSSNNERNLEDFTFNDKEITKNVESNVKRNKNEGEKSAEDSPGEEEPSLEELLFSNDLLLRTIFKHLDVKDLFSSRQVNRLWNLEASKLLIEVNVGHEIRIQPDLRNIETKLIRLKNNKHRIQIKNDTGTDWCAHSYNSTVTMEDFLNLVENSMMFPCNRFEVGCAPMPDTTKDFFRNNGHIVKFLKFEPANKPYARRTTEYDIVLLATKHFPNLELLKFLPGYKDLLPPAAEVEEAIKCSAQMEKLHTLELNEDFSTHLLSLILKKARRLKYIYFDRDRKRNSDKYKIGLEKLFEVQDAFLRLQNIRLEFSPDMLDTFEKVAMQTPKFSTIQDVCASTKSYGQLDLHKVGRILSAIFEQSSESLNDTLAFSYLGHIPGLSIPIFPNLKRLKLLFGSKSLEFYPPVVPFGVKLAEKCPNVKTVTCRFRGYFRLKESVVNHFKELWDGFVSVRHLDISFKPLVFDSDDFVEAFCSFFPNLSSLSVYNVLSDRALEYIDRRGIDLIEWK